MVQIDKKKYNNSIIGFQIILHIMIKRDENFSMTQAFTENTKM